MSGPMYLATVQLDLELLPLEPLAGLEPGAQLTIEERFEHFHRANPGVYRDLRRLARIFRVQRGYDRVGIERLYTELRWEHEDLAKKLVADGGRDPRRPRFRLNDHFTALYARLLMENEPELAGLFELRRRTSTGVTA